MDLHDLEQVAVALAEDGLNTGLELLEAVVRDERKRRTGEAAAVDADCTAALEQLRAVQGRC